MKATVRILAVNLFGLLLLCFAGNVYAAPSIQGSLQFAGGATLNGSLGSATAFSSFTGPGGAGAPEVLAGATGTYASVAGGTPAAFTLFSFNPAPASVTPLWSFSVGANAFSFDATSVTIVSHTPTFLDLAGTGMAHATGYADTTGTWSMTDTGSGPVFTFGGSTIVPEPSALALLGLVPAALALRRRRNS